MMAFMFANAVAPVIAAEGAAATLTAAEILAAEQAAQVLAAQTLAAEQAAALAAKQAAAATATTAANTATSTAANAATNQSILNAIGAGGAPTTAGGIGSIGAAGTGTGTGIMGAQTLAPATAAQTLTPAAEAATTLTPAAETATLSQAELEAVRSGQEIARLSSAAPPTEVTAGLNTKGTMYEGTFLDKFNNPSSVTDEMLRSGMSTTPSAAPPAAPPTVTASKFPLYGSDQVAQQAGAVPPPVESGFMKGISSAMDYMDKNPFKSAIGAYGVAKKTGMLDEEDQPEKKPYSGILSKYKMSSDFKGRQADPQDYQYTPKAYNMASGGIASYRRGGDLSSQLDYYEKMMQTKAPAIDRGDPGIVFDTDPDTRSLDPLTAAQVRMAKVNKRANLQVPGVKRPTPMGQLNLVPVTMKASANAPDTTEAAQGGVMSLGGYAAGGNPRLLRGPGDGMSDNIPATIAGKQPARLADGEFVIPADVVSHLGNGSTEAGAKKLHKMMNDVRKARTGNPKQGKQINPNKFMPK